MELTKYLALLAVVLPLAYGAPTSAMSDLHPEILAAMKRDLGLDAREATARVNFEHQASSIIETLKGSTGASFAGAWISDNGATLNVGITDAALADHVTAAGAKPIVMTNSLSKLESAKNALDKSHQNKDLSTKANFAGIASWYVDVTTNKLVVEAVADSTAEAEKVAKQTGLSASEYDVKVVKSMPTTYATVRGGDAYIINQTARCSIGFSVTGGFVSAGHCGQPGARVTTSSGATLGTFTRSVFPGNADMSFVTTVSGTTLTATIDGYGQGNLPVRGSTAAARGSSICRSGSTSGVHCGTVGVLNSTVNYGAEGTVTGLTQTNACAEPGDSGGSWYSGTQAQGVTSGGSGDCTSGGTTYFQPVNEILQTFGLKLITS